MRTPRTGRARTAGTALALAVTGLAGGLAGGVVGVVGGVVTAAPAQAATVGTVGPSFAGTTAPTGEKPQSKLWYSGGSWWGVLFSAARGDFVVHRLDRTGKRWTDTGVVVDERSNVHVDVLWTGSKLYVASAGTDPTASRQSARVTRFSWTGTTWAKDAGFPVVVADGGMEAVSLDRDGKGVLWATYTRGNRVMVTHSTTADTRWVSPYVLPVPGTRVAPDDISAVVALKGKVGILWGNQKEDAYYFAVRTDGAGDRTWRRETAYQRRKGADDHMNLKVVRNDPQGRLFAFVKTSLTGRGQPLNVLLVRRADGTWDTDNVVGTADQDQTRELVVVDSENEVVYTFVAGPCCSGGRIYMKKASIAALFKGNPFPSGPGKVVMSSSTHAHLNNPASTKQTVNSTTDLVVLAGDDQTKTYMSALVPIGPSAKAAALPPDTTLATGPDETGGRVAFTATTPAAGFECSTDGAPWSACTSPVDQSGLAPGDHTFAVRAVGAAGARDRSPASVRWTVVPPVVRPAPAAGPTRAPAQHSFWRSRWAPLAGGVAVLGTGLLIGGVAVTGAVVRRRRTRRGRRAAEGPAQVPSVVVLPVDRPVASVPAPRRTPDHPWSVRADG